MPAAGLLNLLPTEVLLEILEYLDLLDLLHTKAVCVRLRNVIKGSLELQYKIELAADGLVDGLPSRLTTAERYRLLLDRRRRWRTLDWIEKAYVPIPGPCQAYELVAGVFAKSMNDRMSQGSRHLNATWLPSRRGDVRQIIHEDLGVATRDFAIDPSQDLIALVDAGDGTTDDDQWRDLRVHLRTLSKNAKHPRAASKQLTAPIMLPMGPSFIQIVDDVIGIFSFFHSPGLVVWNWRTGKILVLCAGLDLPMGTWDFSFLSSRSYMLCSTAGAGAIELFSFEGDPPALQQDLSKRPAHVATLRLPPVKDGHEPHQFTTHSGPFVHSPTPGKPFELGPDSRIHLIALSYGDRGRRFHMFVHNRFLQSFVRRGPGPADDVQKVTREWPEWGPRNTRFLEHDVHFQWLRYVHGERVILPPIMSPILPRSPRPECTLCVIDFNVHPNRTDDPVPLHGADTPGVYEASLESSVVTADGIFEHNVVTHLPYAVITRPGRYRYSGFMIDDERIVGMRMFWIISHGVSFGDAHKLNLLIRRCGITCDTGGAESSAGEIGIRIGSSSLDALRVERSGIGLGRQCGMASGKLRRHYGSAELLVSIQLRYVIVTSLTITSMSVETETLPEILVSIPDTTALHVLGQSTAQLGKGDLTLVLTESSGLHAPSHPSSEQSEHTPLLTLTVGKAAFPLFSSTVFGTLDNDLRTYVFTPEIGGEKGGYVEISLPEGVQDAGSPFQKLQTRFEQVLVHHGLLKEGIDLEAVADVPMPSAAHLVTSSSASSTETLARAARRMPTTVSSAAGRAGAADAKNKQQKAKDRKVDEDEEAWNDVSI
ncbi:hypothetical protein WOLCODRAFT_145533 [Wolfiporia cocos MD-104 SS10]|uniref:F-box domain-containing protein n=1 Tax=Wolfiporia cocos (strain MD-104) TaxID=742152 RepID=A0A2H3J7Y1_WOLCO|nr:hypothetical protein WOLCODRAFT_145533 [Wolfiporia cocos MD-104 SS10]